ncbi:MAG TPA: NAD-dependent epimerase/dehydratase family protein, partial [Acidobacteria bacterium]|nr:NAD-dependent epimerase/dehydratase family protein [Acidobacteriota bacterium]
MVRQEKRCRQRGCPAPAADEYVRSWRLPVGSLHAGQNTPARRRRAARDRTTLVAQIGGSVVMRVLVTGAGGFVGRALVARLIASGKRVTALSRRPEALRALIPDASAVRAWQPLEGPPPGEAFEGVDAVVHLAGEKVAGVWTSAKRRAIEDSRVVGTRHLVEGIRAAGGTGMLVSASAIGYYGERGETVLGEQDGPSGDFLSRVCQRWEREARGAEAAGWTVTCLRIGIVLE